MAPCLWRLRLKCSHVPDRGGNRHRGRTGTKHRHSLLLWNAIEDTLGGALMPSLPLLLLQIAFILGACRLLTPVFARLGQPAVMAEMTAGLLLGPSCFGWLAPDLSAFVFPDGSLPTLALISQVGLVLFMFLVGWRLDVGHLRSIGRVAFITSLV